MKPVPLLQEDVQRVIKQFLNSKPIRALSRTVVLALTLLALKTGYAHGKGLKRLFEGWGIEMTGGLIERFIFSNSPDAKFEKAAQAAVEAVEAMEEKEREALEEISEKVGLLPLLLQEALQQQKLELLEGFGEMLREWGSRLSDSMIEGLQEVIAHTKASTKRLEQELATLREQLVALRKDLEGTQISPVQHDRNRRGRNLLDRVIKRMYSEWDDELDKLL